MPHGYADYGGRGPKSVVHALYDLGELAVRLGGIHSIDRLGDIFLVDSFENGIENCTVFTHGVGSSVSLSGAKHKTGGFSCKFVSGSTLGKLAQIDLATPYPQISNMGAEFSFMLVSDVYQVSITLWVFTSTTYKGLYLKYYPGDDALYYEDIDFYEKELDLDADFRYADDCFNTIKMVGDFENGNWLRVITNKGVYDLSGIELFGETGIYDPMVKFRIQVYSASGDNAIVYIDDVMLTLNEP